MSTNTIFTTGVVQLPNGAMAVVKYALANIAAATTDGAIVSAVSGKKIRVLDVKCGVVSVATTITFNTKPALAVGTAISCTFNIDIGTQAFGFNPLGHFETNSGEGLTATTAAGNTIGVQITYIEV